MPKILIVDDQKTSRQAVIDILEAHHFLVIEARDGIEGLTAAHQHHPDLIISDIVMPNLDGYGLLGALAEDEATAAIPVIMLSAREDQEDIRQGMNLGADDYLTKPLRAAQLIAAVQTRLEKQAKIARQSEKKLNELRQNIAYALPHELRTPLNIIQGYSEILVEDFEQKEPFYAESMEEIRRSVRRLSHLTERFWAFTETELFRNDPDWLQQLQQSETLNAGESINRVALEIAIERNRESDLHVDLSMSGLPISERYLRKMVQELVSNAFKFSQPGTPVFVTMRLDSTSTTLQVMDYGRGMNTEQITQIGAYMQFERRYYEQQGIGLGLHLARRLAELHGAQLDIQSEPGQGTVVSVYFPRNC